VKVGEAIAILKKAIPHVRGDRADDVVIRHLDEDVVVVEKTSGLNTVRHPAELEWKDARRELAPTLQDITQQAIAHRFNTKAHQLPRLRIVHRLDKETSGLVVFARSVLAERELGRQFKAHTVVRRYFCIVPGYLPSQTISSWLIRDRGDGRRGSGPEGEGKNATTHINVIERFPKHTALVCQLETGRTHQIRIHLSEAGHPVCGEPVYQFRANGSPLPLDPSAPRLVLHAAELGFVHPSTQKEEFWSMAPPRDILQYLERIRTGG